jgi:uncharacterized protein (DUF433 family)
LHGRVTSSGREYLPALRSQRNNDRTVTWGEFIEASLLKQLRAAGVKLDAIRTLARAVRLAKGWTYPLARHDLYVGESRQLVYEAQLLADIPDTAALIVAGQAYGRGQQVLTNGQALDAFLESVEFADDVPVAYHPDVDASHVVCDARRRFGEPQVAGVPTEALWELVEAGESIEAVAENFALDVTLVGESHWLRASPPQRGTSRLTCPLDGSSTLTCSASTGCSTPHAELRSTTCSQD